MPLTVMPRRSVGGNRPSRACTMGLVNTAYAEGTKIGREGVARPRRPRGDELLVRHPSEQERVAGEELVGLPLRDLVVPVRGPSCRGVRTLRPGRGLRSRRLVTGAPLRRSFSLHAPSVDSCAGRERTSCALALRHLARPCAGGARRIRTCANAGAASDLPRRAVLAILTMRNLRCVANWDSTTSVRSSSIGSERLSNRLVSSALYSAAAQARARGRSQSRSRRVQGLRA
jgi:hypothetical protein